MYDNSWHLDRRVPVALILTIALQTGTGIWWAASTHYRLGRVEQDLRKTESTESDHQRKFEQLRSNSTSQRIQSAVILEQVNATTSNIALLRDDLKELTRIIRSSMNKDTMP